MSVPGTHFARNLIYRRTLLFQLVRRDFEQRYIGSAAGWLWGVVHPLILLISWIFVFEWCLHTKLPPNAVTTSYPLFLFCGFLPWLLFQETVLRSSTSLLEHANLITKTMFPSEIVPVAIFLSSLMNHLLALLLVIVGVGIYIGHFSLWLLTLPIYMLVIGLFSVGVGWFVSSLQVYLRDTAQAIAVVLTLWYWITPIMIDEQQFPQRFRFLVKMNPLAFVVRAYRERLLSYRLPNPAELLVTSAVALTVFVAGGLFFRHLKRGFADVL